MYVMSEIAEDVLFDHNNDRCFFFGMLSVWMSTDLFLKWQKTMAVELLQQLKTSLEGTTNVQVAMYAYLMFTSINYHFFDMWLLRVPSP
jgi:hypothetical protein